MSMKVSAASGRHLGSKIKSIWATTRLLYQVDARAFLISATAGVMEALFYPLLLLIVWKGFSLIVAGKGGHSDLSSQGVVLVLALFAVLALQHLLRIVNETETSILKSEPAQQANGRIITKMSDIPYHFF